MHRAAVTDADIRALSCPTVACAAVRTILLSDPKSFMRDNHPHGMLTADATESHWNGYLLTVACPCGVLWARAGGRGALLGLLLRTNCGFVLWPRCGPPRGGQVGWGHT